MRFHRSLRSMDSVFLSYCDMSGFMTKGGGIWLRFDKVVLESKDWQPINSLLTVRTENLAKESGKLYLLVLL